MLFSVQTDNFFSEAMACLRSSAAVEHAILRTFYRRQAISSGERKLPLNQQQLSCGTRISKVLFYLPWDFNTHRRAFRYRLKQSVHRQFS